MSETPGVGTEGIDFKEGLDLLAAEGLPSNEQTLQGESPKAESVTAPEPGADESYRASEEELQKAVQDAYHRYAEAASNLGLVNQMLEQAPQRADLIKAKETALFLEDFYMRMLTEHRIIQQNFGNRMRDAGFTPKY